MARFERRTCGTLAALMLTTLAAGVMAQQPVPKPFPQPGSTPPAAPPPAQRPAAATPPPAVEAVIPTQDTPSEKLLGVPIFPGAQFLTSYFAGRGQRYYLFGSTSPFAEIVAFYRTTLKQRGGLVFDAPATHMFEVGRFREDTMAFPPGVTVKDYTWGGSGGYLNPKATTQPARFPTIIQIVPVPPAPAR